tara:strand:+ start:2162 stop:2860 length:699 start_codon:yes stop_codon:yes gene_type:complete
MKKIRKDKGNQMKIVSYLRVSTAKQTSTEEQQGIIQGWVKANGHKLYKVIVDKGVSGSTTERDGYKELLQLIENKEVDAVVGWEISRIGRGMINTLKLLKLCMDKKIALIGIGDNCDSRTQIGRTQIKLLMVLYENEAETIGRRLSEIRKQKKEDGKVYNGRIMYGMKRVGDRLEKCDNEIKNIRWIKNMNSRGYSYYKIANMLNDKDIPTKEGGKWQHTIIKRVMNYHYKN